MKRKVGSVVLLVVSLACAVAPSHAQEATIVFCSDRDGDNEIYAMNADGTNIVQLTFNDADEFGAMCSPDGRRIAFVTDRDGNYEVYVMNADGSGAERLTDDPALDHAPSWSRDGSKLAFTSERDGDREIYVMNPDGTGLEQLTFNTVSDGTQDFSPDGTKIVFHCNRDVVMDIWVMDADGSNPQQLTDAAGRNFMPEWSPDGSLIVFESDRDGPLELYIMDADGGNVRRLTYNYGDNHEPDWSPDGSRIMYVAFDGGDHDVVLINPDGTGFTNLTSSSTSTDWSPSWRPQVIDDEINGGGTGMLAFCNQPVSAPDLHEIYSIHIDGTQRRQLIDAPLGLNHHEWSPDGHWIAAVGYVDASTWSIHTFDADGTDLTRLTYTAGVWDNEPSWSPGGTRLAWGRIYPNEGYRAEIWIMDSDGTDPHSIGVAGDGVKWSPDGTRLLYFKELASVDIWTCNVDGSDEQQLTGSAGNNMAPDWSPDGSKIAFVSTRDGNHEIYVMNADGTGQRRFTDNAVYDVAPTWSPDGTLIAFGRDVTGGSRWEVCVMDSSGANVRRVTYSPPERTAINPDWQPPDTTDVPVYLQGFSCSRAGESVRLAWRVAEDAAAEDFRLVAEQGTRQRDVCAYRVGPRHFEALDDDARLRAGGCVVYKLYALGDDHGWDLLGTEAVDLTPSHAGITGVYPNPFNPHTTVSFAVAQTQCVRIDIHDPAGRLVKTLVEGKYPAGEYEVNWEGQNEAGREVASGVYFLRFEAGKFTQTHKLVLVR